MTPLQITRYDRVVRRLMNLVGEGSIVTGVLEDVFPVFDVEHLQPDAWRWSGWRLAAAANTRTAIAGETVRMFLDNPPGSNTVGVLTNLWIHGGGQNQGLRIGPRPLPVDRASIGPAGVRDTRLGVEDPTTGLPSPIPVLHTFDESSAAPTGAQEVLRPFVTSNSTLQLEAQDGLFVIGPGTSIMVRTTTVLSNLQVSWLWRERQMEPAESAVNA